MIKPGVYPVKAVDEYRDFIDGLVKDKEDLAMEKLEDSVESDVYINIRVKMDKLENIMKHIVASSDEGRIFSYAQWQLVAIDTLIDECLMNCGKLAKIVHSCKEMKDKLEEQQLKKHERMNRLEIMLADLQGLVGKVVKKVSDARESNYQIIFDTEDNETFHFECNGGCYTPVWIESIEGVENLVGEEIISISAEEKMMPERTINIIMVTKKGTCSILLCTSSSEIEYFYWIEGGGWLYLKDKAYNADLH